MLDHLICNKETSGDSQWDIRPPAERSVHRCKPSGACVKPHSHHSFFFFPAISHLHLELPRAVLPPCSGIFSCLQRLAVWTKASKGTHLEPTVFTQACPGALMWCIIQPAGVRVTKFAAMEVESQECRTCKLHEHASFKAFLTV